MKMFLVASFLAGLVPAARAVSTVPEPVTICVVSDMSGDWAIVQTGPGKPTIDYVYVANSP